MLKIVMVYRYLLWRVGAESGGALRFRKCTKKPRNVGGLPRKKKHPSPHSRRVENERVPQVAKRPTTFHRISAASTTRAVYTPVKAGERKEKVGRFRREVERFSFLLPHFHRRLRLSCSLLARAYTRSASFLIFAFTAALSPFNFLIFSAL